MRNKNCIVRRLTGTALLMAVEIVAAGALLYVLNELFNLGRELNSPPAFAWGLLFGFLTAYATDLALTVASRA